MLVADTFCLIPELLTKGLKVHGHGIKFVAIRRIGSLLYADDLVHLSPQEEASRKIPNTAELYEKTRTTDKRKRQNT